MSDFSGKVAVITGAGEGIGYEIARQLVEHGASVLLNDVDENKAKSVASEISPEKCIGVGGDAGQVVLQHRGQRAHLAPHGRVPRRDPGHPAACA